MQVKIKIGVIGPVAIVESIREAIKSFPNFIPVFRASDQIADAPVFARELMDEVEVLLFSGYYPYKIAKESVAFSVPVHYVPLTGTGLYRALFRLNPHRRRGSFSIDTLARQAVEKVLDELGEPFAAMHYYGGGSYQVEEMIRFHREAFEQGISDGALTGVKAVSDALTGLGIPNEWVTPTVQDITVSLERALLSTEKRRNKESQIVFGLIQIDGYTQWVERSTSEYDVQKRKLEIHRMFLDYVGCLDGYLTSLGGGEYQFVTTRGIFERETRGYKSIPLLTDAKTALGVSLSIGVGFGKSANEAGTHARLALRQSKEFGGDICFIVLEDRSVIGPVEMAHPMVYGLSITDKDLLQKAEKAGMTAAYMSKLMAQVTRLGKTEYTAQELASILGVTVRSAHRIMLQWLDAGLVEIVGVEKITSRGRPRQVYRLSFAASPVCRGEQERASAE
ncbi:hypothetical protein FOI68_03945 [Brevibacillus sp. LEMMJ03]|jgi:predicted transcriptional regulator|uniref:hypothetical protein n=1 Tax=Brevibacillus TaxID=55080 RepID=UPI000556F164|nr:MULTISPECIES: hypothetical protein [Brevibacillus]TRY27518.1 hypothetical protein FOI68_03945 [Brevibacillus sp. LEMMJ03]